MESNASLQRSLSHGSDTLTQEATVRSLMSRDLAGDPARELSMITIEYPPGSVDPLHTIPIMRRRLSTYWKAPS